MNRTRRPLTPGCARVAPQRGVILFFTLIALVVMSLAAVALIRSVDTSTMISGNMGYKQAAAYSGDSGTEAAVAWLTQAQAQMAARAFDVYTNPQHVLNINGGQAGYNYNNNIGVMVLCCTNNGYRSSLDPALNLTTMNWDNTNSTQVAFTDAAGNVSNYDGSGNQVRYLIQRMCRTANMLPNAIEQAATNQTGCLFSNNAIFNNETKVLSATEVCQGAGCASAGQTVLMRITAKVLGPKNTVSYVQTIVY